MFRELHPDAIWWCWIASTERLMKPSPISAILLPCKNTWDTDTPVTRGVNHFSVCRFPVLGLSNRGVHLLFDLTHGWTPFG